MNEPLTACLRRYAEDVYAFEKELEFPVLVYEKDDDDARLRASTYQLHAIPKSGYISPALGPNAHVLFVRSKKEGADRVTLGRTPENDLVIDDPSVSREHAWFEQKRRGWQIADAGSRNGTVVNGQRLPGKKWVRLEGKATIGFGDINAMFFERKAFLAFLESYQEPHRSK